MSARDLTGLAELKLRLREPLRAEIEKTAKAKRISMNAEIIQRLEAAAPDVDEAWRLLREIHAAVIRL